MTEEELRLITGNFDGWEYVSPAIGLACLILSLFLFLFFKKSLKENLFSYKTVAALGFALYFLVIAYYRFRYFLVYGSDGTYSLMLVSLAFSSERFMELTSPLLLLFALALTLSNIMLIIKEGFYPSNLYAIGIALIMLLAVAAGQQIINNNSSLMLPNWLHNSYCGLFCYFECLFLAIIFCTVYAGLHTPAYDKDFVMILGCKIRPDGTLYPIIRGRVDRAMEFAAEQQKLAGEGPIFVPSGGKGSDECLSEAEGMEKYLLEKGIPSCRILAETKSSTTRENMLFSRKLIEEKKPDAKIAFATTNFHVFRSGMLAASQGWRLDGMGAPTKWYFWPNAFIREFLGLLASSFMGQLIMIALISAISSLLTWLLI